ncbi:MAG TPA: arylsulfatase [Sphingomonas sp.]|nr:arylsulfatase [Sphingomonas sp.]
MRTIFRTSRLLTALCLSTIAFALPAIARPSAPAVETRTGARPNFLVIVADDLGWSDLGAFGGEINTPNLDALAFAGVRFTGFHTAPTCSPTRSMLMSGVDNHEAGLGSMAEALVDAQRGHDGYEGHLNGRVASIAELLHEGGYRTLMAGKWHLGLTRGTSPKARGFERSYALLQGLSNHFGEDQSSAWVKVEKSTFREDNREVRYPRGKFTADQFADKLIAFLEEGARTGDNRPFFAYLTFTEPHWPIQAPREDIAKYKGRYDAGYDALREQRLARQKALGLVAADVKPHAIELAKPWTELTAEEQALQARTMEVYAAMVDRMDQNVGRVIAELKKIGRYDDTVIIFLADNGPEGSVITGPKRNLADPALGIDNSLANIGNANSYVGYGPGWAQANSSPSWLVKGYTTEGGIRTASFAAGAGVAGGRIATATLNVTDIAPTLLQLAGLQQPARYRGHAILPIEGHSLVPLLTASATAVRPASEPIGYELFYRRALRKGDWKAVYLPKNSTTYSKASIGDGTWKLFNLARDPGETTDLATSEPARLQELVADWDAYAKAKGVIVPARDEPLPAKADGK